VAIRSVARDVKAFAAALSCEENARTAGLSSAAFGCCSIYYVCDAHRGGEDLWRRDFRSFGTGWMRFNRRGAGQVCSRQIAGSTPKFGAMMLHARRLCMIESRPDPGDPRCIALSANRPFAHG